MNVLTVSITNSSVAIYPSPFGAMWSFPSSTFITVYWSLHILKLLLKFIIVIMVWIQNLVFAILINPISVLVKIFLCMWYGRKCQIWYSRYFWTGNPTYSSLSHDQKMMTWHISILSTVAIVPGIWLHYKNAKSFTNN